jgi:xanthine dehydrogenase small subunit
MAGTPKRALAVEKALISKPWTYENVADVLPQMMLDYIPMTDMRASAEYRMKAAQGMLQRYLLEDFEYETRVLEVTS